jgi:hypothetical protein
MNLTVRLGNQGDDSNGSDSNYKFGIIYIPWVCTY